MAKNQITGKVIAISDRQSIASKDASRQPIYKRQLYMDCTRYDPYTGERGYENTPLLDFKRKGLERLEALMGQGLKKGDVVTVTFSIQGNKWVNQDKKTQIITSIDVYDIELVSQKQQPQQPAQAPAPAPAPELGSEVDDQGNPLPF